MTIKTGTCHFKNLSAVMAYYRDESGKPYVTRIEAQDMVARGVIHLGPPTGYDTTKAATYIDKDGRYWIVEMEPTDDKRARYKITRFRSGHSKRKVRSGLNLAEAQAHCSDVRTQGTDKRGRWFDGYERE